MPASQADSLGSIPITRSARDFKGRLYCMMTGFIRLFNFLSFLLLSGILAVIAVITLIDPNHFKSNLQHYVKTHTSRTLTIEGKLHWRLSSGLGLEAHNITLSDNVGFDKKILTAKKAVLVAKLWPLFTGNMAFDLDFQGLDLFLEQKGVTQNHWQDLLAVMLPSSKKEGSSTRLKLNSLNIQEANVTWRDPVHPKTYLMKNISFQSGQLIHALSGKTTELSFKGIFASQDHNTQTLVSKDAATSKIVLPTTQTSSNEASVKQPCDVALAFNAEWTFSPNLTIDIQQFKMQSEIPLSTLLLSGNCKIDHLDTKPTFNGTLALNRFETAPWLDFFNLQTSYPLPSIIEAKTQFNYEAPWVTLSTFNANLEEMGHFEGQLKLIPSLRVKELVLQGNLSGQEFHFASLDLYHLTAILQMKNGVLDCSPIDYKWADGEHQSLLQIDFNSALPRYRLTQNSQNFELDAVLSVMGHPKKIAGRTRLKANFLSEGKTLADIRQNLSGQGDIEVASGKIYGIDLPSLLKHAQGTVRNLIYTTHQKKSTSLPQVLNLELNAWQEQAKQSSTLSSPFNTTQGSFTILQGILTNPDLTVSHLEYTLQGSGTLDLNFDNSKYRVAAHYKDHSLDLRDEVNGFLNSTPMIITLQGDLRDPSIRPDLETYMQYALKFTHKNVFEKFVDTSLDKLFETAD